MGYTHKTLPLNVKVMSAFSVSVCVEGTVGGGRGGGKEGGDALRKGEEGSCPGDSRFRAPCAELC